MHLLQGQQRLTLQVAASGGTYHSVPREQICMIVKPIASPDQAGSKPTNASQPVAEPTTLSFEGLPEDQLHVWLFTDVSNSR